MLKLALVPDEIAGGALLECWGGDGAAPVRAREGNALLMDRAQGAGDLAALARGGADDEAALILARLLRRLHAPRGATPPTLIPLAAWFADLGPAAAREGGVLTRASAEAEALLAAPEGAPVALHGDLHHANALDFGRGDPGGDWRAIDPKGLWGEAAYDLVPLLLNPDLADPSRRPLAARPGRLKARVALLAPVMGIDPRRLLRWAAAGAGLSAAWSLADGDRAHAAVALAVAEAALTEMDR